MPLSIILQDITKMKVDAVVNAVNTELRMGGGVCGAIFKAAGANKLKAECNKLAPIRTGEAVITPGFDLPAKYIIHTAGPIYNSAKANECRQLLSSSYINSLQLALENKCESIAFPLISSGIYGYPREEAMPVAITAIKEFIAENDMDVYLVIFDKDLYEISKRLLG